MRKEIRAAIIGVVSLVSVAAIVVGVLWHIGRDTSPVNVYSVENFSMNGSSVGANYYYGPVRADNLQTVFLSNTQTVTEVLVEEGQTVKKGDALLRYDTTLSDIQLERKELAVRQAQLALENAQRELQVINAMKPYTPPPATEPPTEPPTEPLEPAEELPYLYGGKGTRDEPLRILWSEELTYDEDLLREFTGEETEVWLVFELRAENAVNGELLEHFGLRVQRDGESLQCGFFTPQDVPVEDEPEHPDLWTDDSSGYTSAEIAQMRAEKQKEIRDCDLNYRMAQTELERMKAEASDGTVYARLDGTVTRIVDEQTARENDGALLLLSGGGHYYVDIAVDEFTCQTLKVGTPVTAQSWWPETVSYEGKIEEITTTPSDIDGYSGTGNPNVTYYKVVVSLPGDALLQEGSYLDVQMGSDGSAEETLYLQNMFLRYDGGRAYVYVRAEDGTLEKRYLRTGSDLWGYYTEIRSGLTSDDWVAFPYGKNVKEGAQTAEGSVEDLYNYN